MKVLGVLCLIDDGEADWKIIAIDEEDRWAKELNDIQVRLYRCVCVCVHASYVPADGRLMRAA